MIVRLKSLISFTGVIFILLFPLHSNGQSIKLQCKLTMKETFQSGNIETKSYVEVVEVEELKGHVFIQTQTGNIWSAASTPHADDEINENSSNRNKWELYRVMRRPNGDKISVKVTIDRNTGLFSYAADWREGKIVTTAWGACEKVSLEQRKF